MKIGNLTIGTGRTFVIAEAGVNHNGKTELAVALVDAAKRAGADAVKFQSFKAAWMCDPSLQETKAVAALTGGTQSSFDMYRALELSDEAHHAVFARAKEIGITCFSSAFDPRTVDFLVSLGTPALKIASGDVTYTPLIERALATGLPVLISTGMATLEEISALMEQYRSSRDRIILMQCVSEYPMPPSKANLRVLPEWRRLFGCEVGFSDHSLGTALAPAAVALGAVAVEKHFTLDRSLPGPDQKMSLDPADFARMVDSIREVEQGLGDGIKQVTGEERKGRHDGRRGIKAARDLKAGHALGPEDLCIIKPATGPAPGHFEALIGTRLTKDVKQGQPLDLPGAP